MKKYAIAGFIAFFLLEIMGVLYAQILGRFESSNANILFISLFLGVGVGLIGILFGLLFLKFLKAIPTQNEYINAPFWLVIISVGMSILLGGLKSILNPDIIFAIISYVLTGIIFIKITKLNKNESNKSMHDVHF